jgi:site-specific DNA recombinase
MQAVPPTARRAAIYARVSDKVQDSPEKRSFDAQIRVCRDYASNTLGLEVGERIYREVGRRRQYHSRAVLQQALADAERHEFDVLIIWCLDRLSDSVNNFATACGRLQDARVPLKAATEEVDIMTAEGYNIAIVKMAFTVAPENPRRAARVQEVRRQHTLEGRPLAGTAPRYGYQWVKDPSRFTKRGDAVLLLKERLEPDPATAPIVQFMFESLAAGKTLTWIAAELNGKHASEGGRVRVPTPREYNGIKGAAKEWTESVIHKMLASPHYKGLWPVYLTEQVQVGEEKIQRRRPDGPQQYLERSPAPPLVSEALWQAVQNQLAANQRYAVRNRKRPFGAGEALLHTGMARCGVPDPSRPKGYCDAPMEAYPRDYMLKDGTRRYSYRCRRHRRGHNECAGVWASPRTLDRAVWEAFCTVLRDPTMIQRLARRSWLEDHPEETGVHVTTPHDALKEAERRLDETQRQITALTDHVAKLLVQNAADPAITGYDLHIRTQQALVPGLTEEVAQAKAKAADYARHEATVATWEQYLEVAGWNADYFTSRVFASPRHAEERRRWLELLRAEVIVLPNEAPALAVLHLHLTAGGIFPQLPDEAAQDGDVALAMPVNRVVGSRDRGVPPGSPLAAHVLPPDGLRIGQQYHLDEQIRRAPDQREREEHQIGLGPHFPRDPFRNHRTRLPLRVAWTTRRLRIVLRDRTPVTTQRA